MRYFATSRSPFKSRRSPLSPSAGWPEQEPTSGPAAPAEPRYTAEQELALRAWASGHLRKAPLAEQVETLRHYPGLEPVYPRRAGLALESKCQQALQKSADELWAVMWRKHEHRVKIIREYPHIAKAILP